MSVDLVAAVVTQLRSKPALTSSLSENTTQANGTKIWADFAEGRPSPPWLVIIELGESVSYDSSGSYAQGSIQVSVFSVRKKQSRDIGRLVVSALVDSPLLFDNGYLMEFRDSSRTIQVEHAIAPGSPTIYHYIIVFTYLIGRALPTS